jgi:hypothetical protein
MRPANLVLRSSLAALAALLYTAAAQAAPIEMITEDGTGNVTLSGVMGSFELSLLSDQSSGNTLAFQIQGNPPAFGVAAIVFDGTTILSASELSDPDRLITGLVVPKTGMVAGVLVDFTKEGKEASFQVMLSSFPATATIYSLNLTSVSPLFASQNWQRLAIDQQGVGFYDGFSDGDAVPLPEPGAALCFAAGLALVASRLRRRPRPL